MLIKIYCTQKNIYRIRWLSIALLIEIGPWASIRNCSYPDNSDLSNGNQNYALLRNLPFEEKKCPALSKLSAPLRFLSALWATFVMNCCTTPPPSIEAVETPPQNIHMSILTCSAQSIRVYRYFIDFFLLISKIS